MLAALFFHQLQDSADVLFVGENGGEDHGLFHFGDLALVRPARGVVHLNQLAVSFSDLVTHAGSGGDQVKIELALQAFLDYFHVEQAEEAAAKTETEGNRTFRLEEERRVVQAQFFQRFTKLRVFMGVHGIQAREHHRLDFFESGQSFDRRVVIIGDGVPNLRVRYVLEIGKQKTYLASLERFDLYRLRSEHAERFYFEDPSVGPQANLLALAQSTLENPGEHHDTAIGIEPGIEDEGLQMALGLAFRRRNTLDHRLQHVRNALAGLSANQN